MNHRVTALLAVLAATLVWALSGTVAGALGSSASAVPPTRSLVITGTSAAMYPVFDSTTTRYALTTDADTGGHVSVTATTDDPAGKVYVDGVQSTGPTTLTGLNAGDEISVIIDDSASRTSYSVIYLPAAFPKIDVTTHEAGLQDSLIGLTLNTFAGQPAFDAIIDRNGVPVYAVAASQSDLDLKQQPTGEITVSRPTQMAGKTGTDLVTLDDALAESERRHMLGTLKDTDGHDAERLADGSTVLIGYEYDAVNNRTDATIQKFDALGNVSFTWNSSALVDETAASPAVQNAQGIPGDYAHVNSIQTVGGFEDLLVSFRHLSAVLRIATVAHDGYQPGDIIWKLGGRDSAFTFVDDPFGGPCAQHTASMLANGHVLLFDNGTSGLCVDQSDPTGPTVNRGHTRVAEYALDTTTNTATLVWDYTPAGKYALFAGSARRMANGNTLIGWAADRNALATEVDQDGTTLWEATMPASATRYLTYRAEPIALTDSIVPTITTTGPANHATFILDDAVPAGATCSDRGGSNLESCTVTGLTNGHLDTSGSGTRTWTTTATDGFGNTNTVVRSYTVRPPRTKSDGLVRTATGSWKGDNVWSPTSAQTVKQSVGRGKPATFYFLAQNEGERTDTLVLQGMAGTPGFAVKYFANGRDVTKAMVTGTLRTARLAPRQTQQVRVVVTPTKVRGAGPARTVLLFTWPADERSDFDRVGVTVTVPKR